MAKSETQWHLLLGNGFSMWYAKKRHKTKLFSMTQKSIIDIMIQLVQNRSYDIAEQCFIELGKIDDSRGDDYRGLLLRLVSSKGGHDSVSSNDIETIKKYLEGIKNFEEIFNPPKNTSKTIQNHASYIKKIALLSILKMHPCAPNEDVIDRIKKEGFLQFLKGMDNIFTTNYDLILYWIIMLSEKNDKGHYPFSDGFFGICTSRTEYLEFKFQDPSDSTQCYYLHGAFHIRTKGDRTIKLKKMLQNTNFVKDMEDIDSMPPSCVVGGNKEAKQDAIKTNKYFRLLLSEIQMYQRELSHFWPFFGGRTRWALN